MLQKKETQHTRLLLGKNSRKKKVKDKSLIHTLVACIVLSYTKVTLVSMKILAVEKLFGQNGSISYIMIHEST